MKGTILRSESFSAPTRATLSFDTRSQENETQVFASKFKLYLPTEEELRKELKREYQAPENQAIDENPEKHD